MRRYQAAQPIDACPTDYADGTTGTVTSTCPSITLQLNGSAIPLYNSTTYYDKLLWSAAWLYKVNLPLSALVPTRHTMQIFLQAQGPCTFCRFACKPAIRHLPRRQLGNSQSCLPVIVQVKPCCCALLYHLTGC